MGFPKLAKTKKNVQDLNLKAWLLGAIKKRDLNMRKLSRLMGQSDSYVQYLSNKGDFSGAELVYLGNILNINPFEPYLHLLHETNRHTKNEIAQATRIAELDAQVIALEKERDWLKEVVMKG